MFVKVKNSKIPISKIDSLTYEFGTDGGGVLTVAGEEYKLDKFEYERVEQALSLSPMIAAAPGFQVLKYYKDDGEELIVREDVVAWRMQNQDPEEVAVPVTARGSYWHGGHSRWWVLGPSGAATDGDIICETYEDWLEYVREEA